jgi:hypothetical protein
VSDELRPGKYVNTLGAELFVLGQVASLTRLKQLGPGLYIAESRGFLLPPFTQHYVVTAEHMKQCGYEYVEESDGDPDGGGV